MGGLRRRSVSGRGEGTDLKSAEGDPLVDVEVRYGQADILDEQPLYLLLDGVELIDQRGVELIDQRMVLASTQ